MCTSLSDFQSISPLKNKQSVAASNKAVPATVDKSSDSKQCPPDVEQLGRATWTFLHSLAATYPEKASPAEQKQMSSFLGIFSNIYPCWHCATDFRDWISVPENKPQLSGSDDFGTWLCVAHNQVNSKLGKPEFDCSKWKYRWVDGWPDGRCD